MTTTKKTAKKRVARSNKRAVTSNYLRGVGGQDGKSWYFMAAWLSDMSVATLGITTKDGSEGAAFSMSRPDGTQVFNLAIAERSLRTGLKAQRGGVAALMRRYAPPLGSPEEIAAVASTLESGVALARKALRSKTRRAKTEIGSATIEVYVPKRIEPVTDTTAAYGYPSKRPAAKRRTKKPAA